jgi:predicted transcriptional regulator
MWYRELRKVREARNLSASELGRRAGVSHTFIYLMEDGQRDPSLTTFQNLGEALGFRSVASFAKKLKI